MTLEELEEAVRYHNHKYWVDFDPEISDVDFDRLVEQLRVLHPDSAVLLAIGEAGAGSTFDAHTVKVQHDPPMLSLDKCYEEPTLLKWFDKFEGDAVVSPKVDGVATCIHYDAQGKLVQAATRGNGTVGELITEQVRRVGDVPLEIAQGPLEVRGETYMPLDVFEADFSQEYKSPRNLTAGALKQKDPDKTSNYRIRFFAYDLIGHEYTTEMEKFSFLQEMGFNPVPATLIEHANLQNTFEQFVADRSSLNYETDGVVYKANNVEEQQRMGANAHHPRYSIAYKYQGESGTSILREVEWSVSRTGSINPVGRIDPISLSGAVVTRVSLHNLAVMHALAPDGEQLKLNSTVEVTRRGGVIPQIERVLVPGDDEVVPPTHCPHCEGETYQEGDFIYAHHKNSCPAVLVSSLKHFIKALDIKNIGDKLLEQLVAAHLVSSPRDLYTLTVDNLKTLERMGDRSAQRVYNNIQASRQVPANLFLRAFGIHELGRHVSKILMTQFDSLDAIFALSVEDLSAIHTIGDVIAQEVTQGLTSRREEIEGLLEFITPTFPNPQDVQEPVVGTLTHQSFLFTGTLESMTRKEAQQRVRDLGAETPSSVSRTLSFLVIGDKDMERYNTGWRSSKLTKAQKHIDSGLGLRIIDESAFIELLEHAEHRAEEFKDKTP